MAEFEPLEQIINAVVPSTLNDSEKTVLVDVLTGKQPLTVNFGTFDTTGFNSIKDLEEITYIAKHYDDQTQ